MEAYTLFDEIIIFSFMFVWMGFAVIVALTVDKIMWKGEKKNEPTDT